MHKTILKSLLVLILSFGASFALAQDVAPDVLLKGVTTEVIDIIKHDKDVQGANRTKIAAMIETRVLPHFDFARMTQSAVARNWRAATVEQRQTLTAEFKTLLVRTYSTALSNFRNQIIEFKPLRAGAGDTDVMVNTVVKQSGAEPLSIDYAMEQTPAGWKVYDIRIAGVSLIATYRDTFASKVREAGLDGLIKSLADKNRQSRSRQT